MKRANRIWLLLFGAAMLATFSASSAAALPKDCGDTSGFPPGTDVPCDCGDTVTTNTVLNASDPVTRKVCPVSLNLAALLVEANVNLNIASRSIRCAPGLIGIWLIGDGVTVDGGSGIIDGCSIGIFGPTTSGHTIKRVTIRNGEVGISLGIPAPHFASSDDNTLAHNRCYNNAENGIEIFGDFNTLTRNYCYRNGRDGINVEGSFNELVHNQGVRNGGRGVFVIGGNNDTDEQNYGSGNGLKPDCSIDGNSVPGTGGRYC